MTAMTLRPMSVGEILDRAFQIYRRSFARMYVISLVGSLPAALLAVSMTTGGQGPAAASANFALVLLLVPIMTLALLLVWGALAELVDGSVRERTVTVGSALARGLRVLLPLLGASLLVTLLCAVIMVPFGVVMGVVGGVAGATAGKAGAGPVVAVTIAVAVILMLLLLIFVATSLSFFLAPIAVIEGKGAVATFERSWRLGKGARLRVVGTALVAFLIGILPGLAVDVVPLALAATRTGSVPGTLGATGTGLYLALKIAVGALTTPFTVGCMVMAYYDRRVRLEGLDVELASAALTPVE